MNNIQLKAKQGYRTLAVAYNRIENKNIEARENIEKDLTFLCFLAILDPPRSQVRESVEECESGRIKVVMITGDHPNTAQTIASQMRIYKPNDLVIEGSEISKLNEGILTESQFLREYLPQIKKLLSKIIKNKIK